MLEFLIDDFKIIPNSKTKKEWLEEFAKMYLSKYRTDVLFEIFFKPTEKDFEKKMQYMIEMLQNGESSIDIMDVIEYDPSVIWD